MASFEFTASRIPPFYSEPCNYQLTFKQLTISSAVKPQSLFLAYVPNSRPPSLYGNVTFSYDPFWPVHSYDWSSFCHPKNQCCPKSSHPPPLLHPKVILELPVRWSGVLNLKGSTAWTFAVPFRVLSWKSVPYFSDISLFQEIFIKRSCTSTVKLKTLLIKTVL